VSRLFLHCGICARKQADGLISRGFWGHVAVASVEVHACPSCKEQHSDWETRLLLIANNGTHAQPESPRFGATYR
jgi:hypothetical protein